MEVKKIGVIGAGQMGNGIVQVAAASGLEVLMSDINEEFAARGLTSIEKNLARSVEKGKIDGAELDEVLARISTTTELADIAGVDYVVEAAV